MSHITVFAKIQIKLYPRKQSLTFWYLLVPEAVFNGVQLKGRKHTHTCLNTNKKYEQTEVTTQLLS